MGRMVSRKTVNFATLLLRLIVAAVFVLAALPKIEDPQAFANSIANYRICPAPLVLWTAIMLPWLELVAGLGLLVPALRRSSGLIISILLILFIGLHCSAWIRGLEISCGCFGDTDSTVETNYYWLIIRNTGLLLASTYLVLNDLRHKHTNLSKAHA